MSSKKGKAPDEKYSRQSISAPQSSTNEAPTVNNPASASQGQQLGLPGRGRLSGDVTSRPQNRASNGEIMERDDDGNVHMDDVNNEIGNQDADQNANQNVNQDKKKETEEQRVKRLAFSDRRMRKSAREFAHVSTFKEVEEEQMYLEKVLLDLAETEKERELTEDERRGKNYDTYLLQRVKMRLQDDKLSSEEPSDAEPLARESSGGFASDTHASRGEHHERVASPNSDSDEEDISPAENKDMWAIRKILQENETHYKVRWEDTWVDKQDVTQAAKRAWNAQKTKEGREKKQKKMAQKAVGADGNAAAGGRGDVSSDVRREQRPRNAAEGNDEQMHENESDPDDIH